RVKRLRLSKKSGMSSLIAAVRSSVRNLGGAFRSLGSEITKGRWNPRSLTGCSRSLGSRSDLRRVRRSDECDQLTCCCRKTTPASRPPTRSYRMFRSPRGVVSSTGGGVAEIRSSDPAESVTQDLLTPYEHSER